VTIYGTAPSATSQLLLELPAGFAGTIDWPLVPWDVQGSGRVRVAGVEYAAGSAELTKALQGVGGLAWNATLPRSVEVIEATGPLARRVPREPDALQPAPSDQHNAPIDGRLGAGGAGRSGAGELEGGVLRHERPPSASLPRLFFGAESR
jgi:hypothetical protein